MRPRDLHWLQGTAPGPFDPYRLHHREFMQGLSEYRNGLIDIIELLSRIALEAQDERKRSGMKL